MFLLQDAFEINFSCPHGMPERKMGAAVGQDCALLEEVCGWINAKATVPVWAKMTPNITDITQVLCFRYCKLWPILYFLENDLCWFVENEQICTMFILGNLLLNIFKNKSFSFLVD